MRRHESCKDWVNQNESLNNVMVMIMTVNFTNSHCTRYVVGSSIGNYWDWCSQLAHDAWCVTVCRSATCDGIWSSGSGRRLVVSAIVDHIEAFNRNFHQSSISPIRRRRCVCRERFHISMCKQRGDGQIFSEKLALENINYADARLRAIESRSSESCLYLFIMYETVKEISYSTSPQHRFHFSPYQFLFFFSFFLHIHFSLSSSK